jgi:hypothetical protein
MLMAERVSRVLAVACVDFRPHLSPHLSTDVVRTFVRTYVRTFAIFVRTFDRTRDRTFSFFGRPQRVHHGQPPLGHTVPVLGPQQRHALAHEPGTRHVTEELRAEGGVTAEDGAAARVEFAPVRVLCEESALDHVLKVTVNLRPLNAVVRKKAE